MCEPFLLNTFHSQAQWAETWCEVSQLGELWVCVGLYTLSFSLGYSALVYQAMQIIAF